MASNGSGSRDGPGTLRLEPQQGRTVCLCLVGEFDMANAASIDSEGERLLRAGRHLILDLSETTFIDSSAVAALFSVAKRARAERRIAVLQLGTSAIVETVLQLNCVERVLPRASTRADALRAVRQLEPGTGRIPGELDEATGSGSSV